MDPQIWSRLEEVDNGSWIFVIQNTRVRVLTSFLTFIQYSISFDELKPKNLNFNGLCCMYENEHRGYCTYLLESKNGGGCCSRSQLSRFAKLTNSPQRATQTITCWCMRFILPVATSFTLGNSPYHFLVPFSVLLSTVLHSQTLLRSQYSYNPPFLLHVGSWILEEGVGV
jgi:hypothetical protein